MKKTRIKSYVIASCLKGNNSIWNCYRDLDPEDAPVYTNIHCSI